MQTIATPIINQLQQVITDSNKKILFASMPADGHFNPLTSLAKQLQTEGHDVRWYAGNSYAPKLHKLQIPHFPFLKAMEVTGQNIDEVFPERKAIHKQIEKLSFDIIHYFINRGPEYLTDIQEFKKEFDFDVLIADNCFTGAMFVKEKMNIPVILIGIVPLCETSKDLGPSGLGLLPPANFFQKIKYAVMRKAANKIIFGKPNKVLWDMLTKYDIDHGGYNVFDVLIKKADLLLQSGTPGFEYQRSDISSNVRFIGPVLPYTNPGKSQFTLSEKIKQYKKVVLITQGTVESDSNKLIIPTLEALKNSSYLLIVTTGGHGTEKLRHQYPEHNIIIEDFIPYDLMMPLSHVYVTNGGYGGVLLGISNKLPMVVAGVHEGKNEINARVGYFKLGINLNTELPTPAAIRKAVDTVLQDNTYKNNITNLAVEFSHYNSAALCSQYVNGLVKPVNTHRILNDPAINN